MIDNPDYKGEWKPKKMKNPEYKGVWKAKRIPNPDYEEGMEEKAYIFDDFSYVGFDLWQVRAASIFDDLIITDDVEEADKLKKRWEERVAAERERKTSEKEKKTEEAEKKEEETAIDTDDDTADDDEDL